jgi:hypothetical protein
MVASHLVSANLVTVSWLSRTCGEWEVGSDKVLVGGIPRQAARSTWMRSSSTVART